jgi:hypothetical protein
LMSKIFCNFKNTRQIKKETELCVYVCEGGEERESACVFVCERESICTLFLCGTRWSEFTASNHELFYSRSLMESRDKSKSL